MQLFFADFNNKVSKQNKCSYNFFCWCLVRKVKTGFLTPTEKIESVYLEANEGFIKPEIVDKKTLVIATKQKI